MMSADTVTVALSIADGSGAMSKDGDGASASSALSRLMETRSVERSLHAARHHQKGETYDY